MKYLFCLIIYCGFFQFNLKSQTRETFATKQVFGSKKFVTYVFVRQNNRLIPYGTGFFVGKAIDSTRAKVYFATSKHVLKDSTGKFLPELYLRYNLKDGGFEYSEISLVFEGVNKSVFFHTDSTVDLALIPLRGNFERLDFSQLYVENMLAKDQFLKNGIAEGTDVFFTGLFTRYLGEKRNYPISRFGKIALVPEEKIDFVDSKKDLILLETTAYGGNSGSPVFVYYESGNYEIRKLIGIMTGSFEEFNELGILTNPISISKENTGISAITPCNYLIELLDKL